MIPGVLIWVLTLDLSNISNFRFGNSGNYAFGFCLGSGSLVLGLYVGLGISSAAEVLGQVQQICISLICWAQPSYLFQWHYFWGSSAVTWHNSNVVLQHEMAPCYSPVKPGGI